MSVEFLASEAFIFAICLDLPVGKILTVLALQHIAEGVPFCLLQIFFMQFDRVRFLCFILCIKYKVRLVIVEVCD